MPGKLDVFNLGALGINLVDSPIHIPDGAWTLLQNAEFPTVGGQGGVKKRGAIKAFSAALAGQVNSFTNVPLPLLTEFDLMLSCDTGEAPTTWKKSTDGSSFSNLTIEAAATVGKLFTGITLTSTFVGQRAASFKRRFYYPGDNFIQYPGASFTAPPFVVYDGTTAYEMFRVPTNPTSTAGSTPYWISDIFGADEVIYIAVFDPGGSAPDHKGRVMAFDPTSGLLMLVGNRFGNGSGENTAGMPRALCKYLGKLWCGTYGISGNNQGKIYSINVDTDTAWALDHTATLHNGYYTSLATFLGNLYAATDADSTGTAIIEQRTPTGTWSTVDTAPASNVSYFGGLIVYKNVLYCAHYQGGVDSKIRSTTDGSTWGTSLDVGVTYATRAPGYPFIFRDNLYWPFLSSAAGTQNGFLLKFDGSTWTRPLNNVAVRGTIGQFTPDVS